MRTARTAALQLLRRMMIASLALPAVLFVYISWTSYRSTVEEADDRIVAMLDVLQEQAMKVFQTGELIMNEIAATTEGMSDAEILADQFRIHQRFASMSEFLPNVQSLWLVDRDGYALISDYIYPAPRDRSLADRAYFASQVEMDQGTFIGDVLVPRFSHAEPFFSMSRRRPSQDGTFNGVITVSLMPTDFESFYSQLGRDRGSYFAMLREDGAYLARFPPAQDRSHRLDMDDTALGRAITAGGASEIFIHVSELDEVERRVGVRRLDRFPVHIAAGVETAAIRMEWLQKLGNHLIVGLPATLLIFGTLAMAMQRTRRLYQEAERREAAETALRQSQRMEAIGQLTGGIAHDFNNLLMVIFGAVERLRRSATDEREVRSLDMIAMAADRGGKLTRQLLTFARRQALAPEVIDLTQRLPDLEEILRRSLRGDITVKLERPSGPCLVKVDPAEFELALINLAVNARDAMEQGGTLTVRVRREVLDGADRTDGLIGDFVAVSAIDTGTGIAPEVMEKVFEPFFTTKELGKGTGLGLSQIYGFAKQSGGTVTIDSKPGEGTEVRMHLPAATGVPSAEAPRADPGFAEPIRGTVLLVEDSPDVAEVSATYFEQLGLTAIVVNDAQSAMTMLDDGLGLDLVFSDILMPGRMNGIDLAYAVRRKRPGLPVILATGYSASADRAVQEGFTVLRKPYDLSALRRAVRQALEGRQTATAGG